MKINNDVPLDERGQNKNIKFHILDDETMKSYGFGHSYEEWIYNLGITDTISLNIIITDDCEGRIDVLDDDFLQPYDFQSMIMNDTNKVNNVAKTVQKKVYTVMENLVYGGIISGWNVGDYI